MKIFLDVGTHTGETLKIALEKKYHFDKLHCLEPVPQCCEAIRREFPDKRVVVCEYGLWDKDCIMPLYAPGFRGVSVYKEKFRHLNVASQEVRFVRASSWFKKNLKSNDQIYLKLNCEGAECVILDDLIKSGEYKKIDVAMIDFDVRKIPSQRHLMDKMKAKLKPLGIPKIFYIDEFNMGKGTHNYFTHFWLDHAND